MKKILILLLTVVFMSGVGLARAEKAPDKVVKLGQTELAKIGSDPTIVKAVKAQNAKGLTLADIKAMDKKWRADAGLADYMKPLMSNACAAKLKEIQNARPYLAEIFVMDNQGANVAMTDKTSDYWQGDEAKFKESFKGGQGAVHVSDVEFDDSAQAYLVQISVPVMDNGQAIGAITFGLDIDKVK